MSCRWCGNTHAADLSRALFNNDRFECRNRKACDRRIKVGFTALHFLAGRRSSPVESI